MRKLTRSPCENAFRSQNHGHHRLLNGPVDGRFPVSFNKPTETFRVERPHASSENALKPGQKLFSPPSAPQNHADRGHGLEILDVMSKITQIISVMPSEWMYRFILLVYRPRPKEKNIFGENMRHSGALHEFTVVS
jgi:hypothetical protein